jgi:hypothetical protein
MTPWWNQRRRPVQAQKALKSIAQLAVVADPYPWTSDE